MTKRGRRKKYEGKGVCARLRESSKAGRGKESQIRDEFTDRRWIDLSLSRSDWEAEVVDLLTVWVGCGDRQAGSAGSPREDVLSSLQERR